MGRSCAGHSIGAAARRTGRVGKSGPTREFGVDRYFAMNAGPTKFLFRAYSDIAPIPAPATAAMPRTRLRIGFLCRDIQAEYRVRVWRRYPGALHRLMSVFQTPKSLFRTLAFAEAVSWTLLIAGLIIRGVGGPSVAITIGGGIHGFVFLAYGA